MDLSYGALAGLLAVGMAIGLVSGMLGIGGGVFVIPALVILFGFSQKAAVGTSLGMLLPPIGVFAFLAYYKAGHVDVRAALLLAVAFAIGAYVGGRIVIGGHIPENALRLVFVLFMLYVAGIMLFRNDPVVRAVSGALLISAAYYVAYFVMRRLGKKWDDAPAPAAELYRERRKEPFSPDYEI